eukprot:a341840_7.p1 GENE.a341840_7~~a341840_7.p1  ORF type:complete len:375 (+),score=92.18 a341840_7:42-1127(+)
MAARASALVLASSVMVARRVFTIIREVIRRKRAAAAADMAATAESVVVRLGNHGERTRVLVLKNPDRVVAIDAGAEKTFEANVGDVFDLDDLRIVVADIPRQTWFVTPEGALDGPGLDALHSQAGFGRFYALRVESMRAPGLEIVSLAGVDRAAIDRARSVVDSMLAGCSASVIDALGHDHQRVAVIGRNQQTTDIPEHGHLKGEQTADGRDFDAGTRGLGGTVAIPTTSVGEENVLHLPQDRYHAESILVHEFAHHIMNVAVSPSIRAAIKAAFLAARRARSYTPGIYMMANEEEYWAEGVQAWFDASVRTDVNDGVNTREGLAERDPALAALMRAVFGSNEWRYPHSMSQDEKQRWGLL